MMLVYGWVYDEGCVRFIMMGRNFLDGVRGGGLGVRSVDGLADLGIGCL